MRSCESEDVAILQYDTTSTTAALSAAVRCPLSAALSLPQAERGPHSADKHTGAVRRRSSATMRFKNRYLLIQLIPTISPTAALPSLSSSSIYRDLRHSLLLNYGEFGYGVCSGSLQVKYCNSRTGLLLVRCSRDDWQLVRQSMAMLRELSGEQSKERTSVVSKVIHVSGTIRRSQKVAVAWTRQLLLEQWTRRTEMKAGKASEEGRVREATTLSAEAEGVMREAEREISQLET